MADRRSRGWLVAAAAVAACVPLALVPAAGAHVDSPTVTAQHAFIGDPLFGLDTNAGTLFSIDDDDQTAMASTTKVWAFDVTAHALADGVVHLDDPVTINAFEAGVGGSSMKDVNGTPLELGEIVRLEDLIRGMMYPSGNNATYAIARHVAQAYLGPAADWPDFVQMMNDHAAAEGLADTQFQNPNGFDAVGHYTTAQELAEQLDHGLQDPYFAEVVGFNGTWNATTQGPNGPKMYALGFGRNYPGWEGEKNGITTNCNGPANGCIVMAAKRIGRRVLTATMQGTRGVEEPGMLDYGFGQIFHPDPRGSSSTVGVAQRHEVVCPSSTRCLTVALPDSGDVELVSWAADVDSSSMAVLDQESLPGSALPPKNGQGQGPGGDVALTRLFSGAIVVANRKGASVELSRWSMDGGGALSLLDSDIKMGPATTMDLQPVYADMFLSAVTDPDGALVLKSWQLDGSSIQHLDTYRDESRAYSEVAMAGPLTTDVFNGHRAVTASIAPGQFVHDVWGVDQATGEITLLGELVQASIRHEVEISPFFVNTTFEGELFPPVYYATVARGAGVAVIRFYRITVPGAPVDAGLATTGIAMEGAGLAPLATGGLFAAILTPGGAAELLAFDVFRNANNFIADDVVSQHTAPLAGSLDLARVPSTHAEGDYVTAVTEPLTGQLRLRAFRSGDRPY
ncbi:MAG TPA: serine hydrolase [Gaiellaceae bacterium]|nr:serine hydrolase [Gaiellaceae bacterium]